MKKKLHTDGNRVNAPKRDRVYETIPLRVPAELQAEIVDASRSTHLTQSEVMRQAIRLGLPLLRKGLAAPERRTA